MSEKDLGKVLVESAGIDQDVLDNMNKDNIISTLTDQKLMNRAILNCMCEFLSEIKKLNESLNDMQNIMSICANEKIQDFFIGLRENIQKEEAKATTKDKIKQSHKKKSLNSK
jgi:hypothetical protein